MRYNPILDVDSYKTSHFAQYPANAEFISSYIESRGSEHGWPHTTVGPYMPWLVDYASKPIEAWMIDRAERRLKQHGPSFNRAGWEYILNKHRGHVPIMIEAVPEGLTVPTGNVLMQMVNTDPVVPWVTSYKETGGLRGFWFPTTVATQDLEIKRTLKYWLEKTSDLPWEDLIGFMVHDFGGRGVSSYESANIGGMAHMVHFLGTDTISSLEYIEDHYGDSDVGYSVDASEHSTITCWGGEEGEILAFENMIDKFAKPGKIFACVSDSYDILKAADKWYSLREKLINSGAKLMVRPDSGEPTEIVPVLTNRLMDKFGFTTNKKGYDVLPPYLGVIQGDGINHVSIDDICAATAGTKLSTQNFAFGMGGAMLQHVNRDTMKFAMKASAIQRDGVWHDVYKDPVTDPGKRSKRGRLALVKREGIFQTIRREEVLSGEQNYLQPVFLNGKVLEKSTFAEIRELASRGV